jgi:hypothetical protein
LRGVGLVRGKGTGSVISAGEAKRRHRFAQMLVHGVPRDAELARYFLGIRKRTDQTQTGPLSLGQPVKCRNIHYAGALFQMRGRFARATVRTFIHQSV